MSISMDSLPPRYQKQAARKLDPAAYEKALQFFHAEEAKSPASQAQGSISHALGESFEAQILTACEYYRSICHAEIDKTPEPIKVISGRHQNPSGCWSFEAVFTKQAQPDFQGTIDGGRSVVFEAKATDKDRILQSAVTHEQAYAMQSHAQKGALVFVLVCLRGRAVYRVMARAGGSRLWCADYQTTAGADCPLRRTCDRLAGAHTRPARQCGSAQRKTAAMAQRRGDHRLVAAVPFDFFDEG